jgi:hypothetical protein
MALAALGAAVLARTAFDRRKTGRLEPPEMQLLARLMLGPPEDLANAGELRESLTVALACDRDDLRDVIDVLTERGLISARQTSRRCLKRLGSGSCLGYVGMCSFLRARASRRPSRVVSLR